MKRISSICVLTLLVAAFALSALVGCGATSYSRNAEITHWHDEDTIILVYTRQQTGGTFRTFFRPEPKSMHVRVCKVLDDNSLECEHQRRLTNLLNPHVVDGHELDDKWQPRY